jgi:hypothetical protein
MPTYDRTYASLLVPSKICSWLGFNLILTAGEQSLDLLASWYTCYLILSDICTST